MLQMITALVAGIAMVKQTPSDICMTLSHINAQPESSAG